jgi:hypothetical protein
MQTGASKMYNTDIQSILDSFIPVGLSEMDEVSLMNRVETKYVFCSNRLPEILGKLSDSYKVLEIEKVRIFPYNTVYLDTPDFLFYMQQVRGKLSRHKIRYRKYESTGVTFLEIKKRTNKNRTIKWRIENSLIENATDSDGARFINNYLPDCLPDLHPVLDNGFNRITLVGVICKERITLDYNLTFGDRAGKTAVFPFLAIAELKRECNSCYSPFGNTMKNFGIRPTGFSKYCMGSTMVKDMPRKNVLKPNLLLINKIENEYTKSAGY